MKQDQSELTREQVLLRAAAQILRKQSESGYVLNLLDESTVWDKATCDGNCLLEEIETLLSMSDVDVEYVDPDHDD